MLGAEREPLLEALMACSWKMETSAFAEARKEAIRAGCHRRKAEVRGHGQAEDGSEMMRIILSRMKASSFFLCPLVHSVTWLA